MPTILETYAALPRPRLGLADWLDSLPAADRDALYAATTARVALWDAADHRARLRNWAAADAPAQSDALTAIADQIRGLRDDLLQQPAAALTPRPRLAPQYARPQSSAVPTKPAPKSSGVDVPHLE